MGDHLEDVQLNINDFSKESSLEKSNSGNDIIPQFKVIYDSIHGYIHLSNLIVMVMDSRQFQRLRKLKQLGSCYYVYQNAIHSRFEHSIGTSHLAGEIMETIMINTEPLHIENYMSGIKELKSYYDRKYDGKMHIIDNYIIELVRIAALCHDLGHGPFSHVFDDFFLPTIDRNDKNIMDSHEARSGSLLEQIIKENKILSSIIADDEVTFMKNIISPKTEHIGFLYQIVSNNLNGLDVDKYDYIARDSNILGIPSKFKSQRLVGHIRVIDDIICYPEQAICDIVDLYMTRYNLHKTVYSHKAVISAQCMITEIFSHLDKVIGLSGSVNDINKFCTMTDEYILTCHNTLLGAYSYLPVEHLLSVQKAKGIIDKLDSHKLYPCVDTCTTKNKLNITSSDFTVGEEDKIIVYTNKIGLVSGSKKNPLDSVYTYKTKDAFRGDNELKINKVDISKYSLLIANNYQEYITMIFYKDRNEIIVQALRDQFQELIKLSTKN